jgi:hypothetical protein
VGSAGNPSAEQSLARDKETAIKWPVNRKKEEEEEKQTHEK